MTAVTEDLDLSWAEFADDCQWWQDSSCPAEPVAVAWWDGTCCGEASETCRLCASHRDDLAQDHARGCRITCGYCDEPRVLLRIEPLR